MNNDIKIKCHCGNEFQMFVHDIFIELSIKCQCGRHIEYKDGMVLISRVLTDDEMQKVQNYLAGKYNIR